MEELIKSFLKKNRKFVTLYEKTMEPLHNEIYRLKKELRNVQIRITTKKRFSFGDLNPNKVFLVVRLNSGNMGPNSFILCWVLPALKYAYAHGMIPIIDLKNSYMELMQDKDKKGKENSWEYYFQQPDGNNIPLEEIYQSKNVYLLEDNIAFGIHSPVWMEVFTGGGGSLMYWSNMFNKHIKPISAISNRVSNEINKLPGRGKAVLAVPIRAEFLRGQLLNEELYVGHPVVPSCEDLIVHIKDKMDKWGYKYLFVASDDREYLEAVKEYFGDKCFSLERERYHFFENGLPVDDQERMKIEYSKCSVKDWQIKYYVETYMLAMCDGMYGCFSGQADVAYLINGGKYRHYDMINMGTIQLQRTEK